MATKAITDDSFATDVLSADGPVLVDFWATWCGPCKQIGPSLEMIAKERAGKLTVAKMDIDDNPETPGRLGVRGVPTLMIFNKGELVSTSVGAKPKGALDAWIDQAIGARA